MIEARRAGQRDNRSAIQLSAQNTGAAAHESLEVPRGQFAQFTTELAELAGSNGGAGRPTRQTICALHIHNM